MTSDFRWDAKLGSVDGAGILKFNMVNGEIAYGYHGGHFAYAPELWYVPTRKLTIAYLTNGSSWLGVHVKPLKDFQLRVSGELVNEMDKALPEGGSSLPLAALRRLRWHCLGETRASY